MKKTKSTSLLLGFFFLVPSIFSQGIPNYPCYRTVEETFSTAQKLTEKYPNLASWVDVGDSWQKTKGKGGHDMMVLVLTNKKIKKEKPKLFTTSAIHAREFATAELMTRFAENLLNNYDKDPDVTWMLDHQEMHLMLITNPDGRKKAEPNVMWRKNVNTTICSQGGRSRQGVDLNRNFSFKWGSAGSTDECSETYRGKSAASEPETQAVEAYQRKLFKDVRGPNKGDKAPDDTPGTYIDIHAYGEIILYPKGMGNSDQMTSLVRKYAYLNKHKVKFIDDHNSPEAKTYIEGKDLNSYEDHRFNMTFAHGYGELGVASYLFELGKAFFEKCDYFEKSVLPNNFKALKYAFQVVRAPYLLPSGPDALNVKVTKDGEVSALLDDTRFGGSGEPTHSIASAEIFVDTPPWDDGAKAIPMTAKDGKSDSSKEAFTGKIDISNFSSGKHIIFVRGKDQNGSIGPVSSAFLVVD